MRYIGKFWWLVAALFLLVACSQTEDAGLNTLAKPSGPALSTLEPGEFKVLEQDLNINVVFVGYEEGDGPRDISADAFLGELPETYHAVNRFPSFYGLDAELGVNFSYNYNLVYAGAAFENDFFSYLSSVAEAQPLTIFQEAYNAQENGELDIATNHWIDAPSVEQWLADNAGAQLGVDTSEYTVFFVNWYGRDDFIPHVYVKTDEPDPDTGLNFGLERDSRKMIAWGGTTPDDEESGLGSLHRIWFYDLSAGPEAWTDNWNVDTADLDENGELDYRMPPVWEYGTDGYRDFDNLSGDLGKVTRYVAINLLFTASPLYKPALSPPLLPDSIQVDTTVYDFDGTAAVGTEFFDADLMVEEWEDLKPLNEWSFEVDTAPFSARFEKVYRCFYIDDSCFGNRLFGIAFADLFLYFNDHIIQFLEGDADYEIPTFAFNASDELFTCCLGFADDNWADGTQSFVFAFDSPGIRNFSGYGFTTTTIHEVGHHVGMSHPHDGYDYETDTDYGPSDAFQFVWSGDQSNSMMSYIDLNWDFSQFDRDNMNRYMTSIYLNQSNVILEKIYKSPRVTKVSAQLLAADAAAASAVSAYGSMDYLDAVTLAKAAYDAVVDAARTLNVRLEPQSWQADYKSKSRNGKFVDGVDYGNRHRFN